MYYINTNIKISFWLCILFLFSCGKHPKEDYIEFNTPKQEICIVHNDSSDIALKNFLNSFHYKCMVFLDGNCGACLSNLPTIHNFFDELTNIPAVFVIKTKSMKTFDAFCFIHNLNLKTIQDSSNVIQRENKSINTNFILLNEKNEIITQGNPIEQPKIKKLYQKLNKEKI